MRSVAVLASSGCCPIFRLDAFLSFLVRTWSWNLLHHLQSSQFTVCSPDDPSTTLSTHQSDEAYFLILCL